MIKKVNWLHLIYIFIFGSFAIGQCEEFFFPASTIASYYKILIAFNPTYYWLYAAGAIKQILTIVSLLPIILFFIQRPSFNHIFWLSFLFIRLIFDIAGSHYEFKVFYSFAGSDITYGVIIAAYHLALSLPSYIMTFLYAQGSVKPTRYYL